jgi:hypothetical protein
MLISGAFSRRQGLGRLLAIAIKAYSALPDVAAMNLALEPIPSLDVRTGRRSRRRLAHAQLRDFGR